MKTFTLRRPKNRPLKLNSARWRKLRQVVLARNPLCAQHQVFGELVPAVDVDHIDNDPTNNSPANLVGLCRSCHAKKTAIEMRGKVYLMPYLYPYTLETNNRITMVCGAAGSGKSTYVKNNKADDDVVIDLDDIRSTIPHEWGDALLKASLIKRNQMLSEPTENKVWFIVSAGNHFARRWWIDKLKPIDVIVLDTPLEECIARIKSSHDGKRREQSIKAAIKWWDDNEKSRAANPHDSPPNRRARNREIGDLEKCPDTPNPPR